MNQLIKYTALGVDAVVAQFCPEVTGNPGSLLVLMFHSLFRDKRETDSDLVDPQQGITIPMFRSVIAYLLEHSYLLVSPADLQRSLPPERQYALLTFDDGYFNNSRALPVLEEFAVPA